MTQFFTLLFAVIIFAVLIFVHEFGHFITAKLTGVKVLEFALGMGPKIFSFKRGETLYSLRAVPIGGFCSMEGEDGNSNDERAFFNKSAPKRLLVLVAGAAMNILLGFILLIIVFSGSKTYISNSVFEVSKGSAAEAAGMLPNDEIVKINSAHIHLGVDIHYEASSLDDENVVFTVKRDGKKVDLNVKRNTGEPFGITLKQEKNNAFSVIKQSYYQTFFYSKVILSSLIDLLKGKVAVSDMSGPIGIVSEIGSAVDEGVRQGGGFLRLFSLTILLTINLGIFNLLPIPALDGGRILFVLIELVIRKRLPPEKEGLVHMIGFVALMLFAVFIAYMDVLKLIK